MPLVHDLFAECDPQIPAQLAPCATFRSVQGDGKAALKGVCRASLRLSRPGALRFSSGLFLHLATDACFTILEQVRIVQHSVKNVMS